MSGPSGRWQLAAGSTGAVLFRTSRGDNGSAVDPAALPLSPQLVRALRDWGQLAAGLTDAPVSAETAAELTERGRRLAGCIADELDVELAYVDPATGELSQVDGVDELDVEPDEPPWAPGLFVSGVFAVIVAVVLVSITLGLADVHAVLAVIVNLAIVMGLAPSVWLGRTVPTWRWPAWGTGVGILAAWIVLLLSLLGG